MPDILEISKDLVSQGLDTQDALLKGVAERSPKALTDAIEQVCCSSVAETVACSVAALLQRGGEIAEGSHGCDRAGVYAAFSY